MSDDFRPGDPVQPASSSQFSPGDALVQDNEARWQFRQILRDADLMRELAPLLRASAPGPTGAVGLLATPPGRAEPQQHLEAIVRAVGRPSLLISGGRFEMPRSGTLAQRLLASQRQIERAIPTVGRLEFSNDMTLPYAGTAWAILPGVLVTNRHVAALFCEAGPGELVWKVNGQGEPLGVVLNPGAEFPPEARPRRLRVRDVLFVDWDTERPDVALLLLDDPEALPGALPLLETPLSGGDDVAVIGYPARDARATPDLMDQIFGEVYNVKRLSPGRVIAPAHSTAAAGWAFTHDATTLGGNSGSLVLDMRSGAVAGLHFRGQEGQANFAVTSAALLDTLTRAGLSGVRHLPRRAGPEVGPGLSEPRPTEPSEAERDEATRAERLLELDGRSGYDPGFLGTGFGVPLPGPGSREADLLHFQSGGKDETVLRYTHFSLSMSVSRRLCLWTAVNIDGLRHKLSRRGGWHLDPRLPAGAQTSGEVYGNFPAFSRGHMTRRQDPIWGDTQAEAKLGGDDTMHYTNAVPQIQMFNAGIWNELEDYALDHTRDDQMRVSVFTGPVLAESDPARHGVQIPLEFWKIIVFVHDLTGKLSASGYLMDQSAFLGSDEFVFGPFGSGTRTYQVALASIEARTGLQFGLTGQDVYAGQEDVPLPLTDPAQIRWV